MLDCATRLDFAFKEELHNLTASSERTTHLLDLDDGQAEMFKFLAHEVVREMEGEEVLALDAAKLQRRMAPLYSHTFRGKFNYGGYKLYGQVGAQLKKLQTLIFN